MKYLLLFLLPFSLYASKILSYNIYERTNRADVMLTFDTPYQGTIKQSTSSNKIIIKLKGASIESPRIKKVDSSYLHSLTITPLKGQTQIVASISPNVRLIVSKTTDAYGLRLRFTDTLATKQSTKNTTSPFSALPTKKDSGLSTSYYVVVSILVLGIIILLVLKKKMSTKTPVKQQKSWLFNSNDAQMQSSPQKPTPPEHKNGMDDMVSIRFQKAIDEKNSVVMLDFANESYLVLMGNSNILLDKFKDDIPTSQQEFESILQERNQELESFLGTAQPKEPLQAYKERAASLIYADED